MKKCKILFSLLLFVLLIGAVFYASLTSQFEFGSFEIKFNEYIIVSRIDIAVYCLVVVFVALYVLQFFIKKIIFSPRLISKMIKQNSINNNIDVLKSYIFANHIQDDQSISMLKPKIDKIIDNELYQSVVKIDSYVKNNETEKALIALSDLERNQKTERYAFKKSIELSCLNQKDKNAIIIANKAIKIYPNDHYISQYIYSYYFYNKKWKELINFIKENCCHLNEAESKTILAICYYQISQNYNSQELNQKIECLEEAIKCDSNISKIEVDLIYYNFLLNNNFDKTNRKIIAMWRNKNSFEIIDLFVEINSNEVSKDKIKNLNQMLSYSKDNLLSIVLKLKFYLSEKKVEIICGILDDIEGIDISSYKKLINDTVKQDYNLFEYLIKEIIKNIIDNNFNYSCNCGNKTSYWTPICDICNSFYY